MGGSMKLNELNKWGEGKPSPSGTCGDTCETTTVHSLVGRHFLVDDDVTGRATIMTVTEDGRLVEIKDDYNDLWPEMPGAY